MSLTREHAAGMTVNERLAAAGLMSQFDDALPHRDEARLRDLLTTVFLDNADVEAIVARVLSPAWAVVVETANRFAPGDWVEATNILQNVVLPLIDQAGRQTERARVQLALIKLSAGDIMKLRGAAHQASIDWRDVLVTAGLADGNWRYVLSTEGFSVPGEAETK